ncbi:MAG: efflux RND transporter periplasmic adaptor subunit [Chromatiaceae bacterium]|nr:efflux RND transporter periplasmic adaptor subunit [Chromatiaceae bacterium]
MPTSLPSPYPKRQPGAVLPRCLLYLLGLSLAAGGAQAGHEIAISQEQMQRIGISLVAVEAAQSYVTDRLPARVTIPPQQVRVLSASRGGLVTALNAAESDEVKAGAVLADIESPGLVGLQRELLQAATQLRLAQAELQRNEQLRKTKSVSDRIYLESRSTLDEAEALVDERRQVLLLAGMTPEAVADLEQARRITSTLQVRSPIDGVVVEVPAVLGERVEDSEPLYRVARLEPLWLEISAPLDRLQGVQPGGLVEIPCKSGEAHVDLIGRKVDPANQTVLVRAEVTGAGDCLRPGQFVEVRLQLSGTEDQLRLPSSAITRIGDTPMVFVHEAAGFAPVSVTVVAREGEYSVVTGGLAAGSKVAASGIASIKAAWTGRYGAGQ